MSSKTKTPSRSAAVSGTSMNAGKNADDGSKKAGAAKKQKKTIEFSLPPFSILPKKPKEEINWELIKRNMSRRQSPEGEDLPALKKILREIGDNIIPVHDFVNMVSAYTVDNGAYMRQMLEEDTALFRKLARKVYETMTQDISDVLVNEQLQLTHFYQERHDLMTEKMMRAVSEIYEMIPNFDFELFIRDGDRYLKSALPIPASMVESEDDSMQKRQQAYHRLQWLKSEGERMSQENKRLQRKLEELKIEQQLEQERIAQIAAEAEAERDKLTKEESHMKEKLEELNNSMEESMIATEAALRQVHEATVRQPPKKDTKKAVKKHKKERSPEWITQTASEMESESLRGTLAAEAAYLPPLPTVKHPPEVGSCGKCVSPVKKAAPMEEETKIETATSKVQEQRVFRGRRSLAPKDTWGGFY